MEFTIGLLAGLLIGYILHRQYIKSIQEFEDARKKIKEWEKMMIDNYVDSQRQAEKLSEILQKAIDMETEHDRRFKEAEETIKAGGQRYPRKEQRHD